MANLFTKKYMKVPHVHSSNVFKEIGRNAYVDWLFILIITTLVAIVLMAGGGYLYWQISTGNFATGSDVVKKDEKIFDQKQLENIINKFQAKEDNSKQTKTGYRGPSDPGL